MIGKQVGNYRIDVKLGEDGLGWLYAGMHVAAGFPATLRHFAEEFADVRLVARYLELGRVATQANHPHIFNVRESVWSGRNAFIAGEPLPPHGNTLLDAIRGDGKIIPELTVKIGWQLADALGAAHALNLAHCYLRPETIWVFADPQMLGGFRAKIMDFGVQAYLRPGQPDWRSDIMRDLGLPYYAAPEQCRSGIVDFRSDVYSLGCILFHMTAGRPPFGQSEPEALAEAHKNVLVRGPAAFEPTLPPEADALIQRMMSKGPNERPTMPQVAFELDRIWHHYWPPTSAVVPTMQVHYDAPPTLAGEPPPPVYEDEEEEAPRRWPIIVAGAGLAVAVAGLALAVSQPWKKKSPEPSASAEERPAVVVVPDAAPAVVKVIPDAPPPKLSAHDQAIADAKKALLDERWDDALKAAKEAQDRDPSDRTAAILIKQAQTEPANKKLLADFMKAIEAKDLKKALPKLKKIPPDSLYLVPARKAWSDLVAEQVASVKALADAGNCAKAKPLAMQVFDVEPDAAADLAKAAAPCK